MLAGLVLLGPLLASVSAEKEAVPVNPEAVGTATGWCDCGTGIKRMYVWPYGEENEKVSVAVTHGSPQWVTFNFSVSAIQWTCDGMGPVRTSTFDKKIKYLTVQHTVEDKGHMTCMFVPRGSMSGRLKFVGYREADHITSIPFTAPEGKYPCVKIPTLLKLSSGVLLAMAEARTPTCSDNAATDLVVKHSQDGGKTWSQLRKMRGDGKNVVGNAAPVQLSQTSTHPGRILVPHNVNNQEVWHMYSDDDGLSWSDAQQIPNVIKKEWASSHPSQSGNGTFVAAGPPGSIQLRSGRVLVPSYHFWGNCAISYNCNRGHIMLSDDEGDSWYLGADGYSSGDIGIHSGEAQAVQLQDGSVLLNARSYSILSTPQRVQAISHDEGLTFGEARFVPELPVPIAGCEGSIVSTDRGNPTQLLYSGPDSVLFRKGMTIWKSDDEGKSWGKKQLIDAGAAGYSSLQVHCQKQSCEALILYEQGDKVEMVMKPDRFVFKRVPLGASVTGKNVEGENEHLLMVI